MSFDQELSHTMVNVSSSYTHSKQKGDESAISGLSDEEFMASYMKERVEDIYQRHFIVNSIKHITPAFVF